MDTATSQQIYFPSDFLQDCHVVAQTYVSIMLIEVKGQIHHQFVAIGLALSKLSLPGSAVCVLIKITSSNYVMQYQ